ncbi:MAG: deoxyribodipyrimidine photo-lyase [Candidatus Kapaibacterium sp.]
MMYNIFWFRRDLRLDDNVGLYHALSAGKPVIPLFIFDKTILDELDNVNDRRVTFIYKALENLQTQLLEQNSTLLVRYGTPAEVFTQLLNEFQIDSVFTNHDYEPQAIQRDSEIQTLLRQKNIRFSSFKDQCIFEKDEILNGEGKPYTVFTPYSKRWKQLLTEDAVKASNSLGLVSEFWKNVPISFPSINELGFVETVIPFPSKNVNIDVIQEYHNTRDVPSIAGTSRLSVHLRFGTISIRSLVKTALSKNEKYLNELIWREFYMMILWNFPHVVTSAFKLDYNDILWRNDEAEFEAWCAGRTGYPIVDAGIRQLLETGYMHNRVRMITASFLTKHLLIDWKWGEAFFAKHLLDFELSSNNGGWQWAAGCGCDAAPYFRIFNPYLQTAKFDPIHLYIKQWVPEFGTERYPTEIVNHENARKRCLETYQRALGKSNKLIR